MKLSQAIVALCACGFLVAGLPWLGPVGPGVALAQVTLLGPNAIPHAISADGRTAVGELTDLQKAFVWTPAGGRYDFGQDPGMPAWSSALAVSQDGHTVVGASAAGPFRWQGAGTFQPIGSLPSPFNVAMAATGVSGDGSRVVGYGGPLVVGPFASFSWTSGGGMQQIPGVNGRALGMSRDGSRAVGSTGQRGFTWSPSGGGVHFLQSQDGTSSTEASAINFDGTIVVGWSGPLGRATIWRNEVPTELPNFPGIGLTPTCLSDDAGVVAGWGTATGGISNALVWTPSRGTELFSTYLTSMGISFPAGFSPSQITGTSSDGVTFCGYGDNGVVAQGFVVTLPAPSATALLGLGLIASATRRRR